MLTVVFCLVAVISAHGAQWRLASRNVATIDVGVSFNSDLIGYTAGTQNGQGPVILKSTDGARSFTPCNVTSFGADILLLDVDSSGDSVIVSTIAGEMYSDDGGKSFHQSIGGGLSQSVRHIGPTGDGGHKYACAGNYALRNVNGVAVTVNSGRTFQTYDAKLYTPARYGAYPNTATWLVAAGQWPESGSDDHTSTEPLSALARKSQIFGADGNIVIRPSGKHTIGNSTNGYQAQISITTDGGINWKTVFAENGTFYFNGIDCSPSDASHCCAVGEGFTDASGPSTEPGARIHCTKDGGVTWTRTFWAPQNTTSAHSLMEIRYANATEVWAVGGVIGTIAQPMFLHSSDGGNTWTVDLPATLDPGSMAVGLSFPTPSVGFAVLLNSITQAASIAKYE